MYEQSIDTNKKDGWLIRLKSTGGANESLAFGVGESMIRPQKLDESNTMFTLKMNKDFTNRIRKVDVERQQLELKKIHEIQGQGAALFEGKIHATIEEGYSQNLSEMPNVKITE